MQVQQNMNDQTTTPIQTTNGVTKSPTAPSSGSQGAVGWYWQRHVREDSSPWRVPVEKQQQQHLQMWREWLGPRRILFWIVRQVCNTTTLPLNKQTDDHGILMKFFKDFNLNFGSQKIRWPLYYCEIPEEFYQNYFQDLNDHRILQGF